MDTNSLIYWILMGGEGGLRNYWVMINIEYYDVLDFMVGGGWEYERKENINTASDFCLMRKTYQSFAQMNINVIEAHATKYPGGFDLARAQARRQGSRTHFREWNEVSTISAEKKGQMGGWQG